MTLWICDANFATLAQSETRLVIASAAHLRFWIIASCGFRAAKKLQDWTLRREEDMLARKLYSTMRLFPRDTGHWTKTEERSRSAVSARNWSGDHKTRHPFGERCRYCPRRFPRDAGFDMRCKLRRCGQRVRPHFSSIRSSRLMHLMNDGLATCGWCKKAWERLDSAIIRDAMSAKFKREELIRLDKDHRNLIVLHQLEETEHEIITIIILEKHKFKWKKNTKLSP